MTWADPTGTLELERLFQVVLSCAQMARCLYSCVDQSLVVDSLGRGGQANLWSAPYSWNYSVTPWRGYIRVAGRCHPSSQQYKVCWSFLQRNDRVAVYSIVGSWQFGKTATSNLFPQDKEDVLIKEKVVTLKRSAHDGQNILKTHPLFYDLLVKNYTVASLTNLKPEFFSLVANFPKSPHGFLSYL